MVHKRCTHQSGRADTRTHMSRSALARLPVEPFTLEPKKTFDAKVCYRRTSTSHAEQFQLRMRVYDPPRRSSPRGANEPR